MPVLYLGTEASADGAAEKHEDCARRDTCASYTRSDTAGSMSNSAEAEIEERSEIGTGISWAFGDRHRVSLSGVYEKTQSDAS